VRVLLLAPEPFYEDRGTLIAVDLLIRAMVERGDQVDLLTYHLGANRTRPGLEIHRIRPWPRPARIRPGLSIGKIWCDVFMFFKLIGMVRRTRYDLIHAVEESAFMAMLVGPPTRTPYVFDMDSSMAGQIVARFRWARPFGGLLRWLETLPMRRAAAVVPMCEDLAVTARKHTRGTVQVLSDITLLSGENTQAAEEDLRATLGLRGPVVMYIGNLEPYQGIDLLIGSFREALRTCPQANLVIIGGIDADIKKYRQQAVDQGISESVHLVGPRPVGQLGGYMSQTDILVSPRIEGTNTPMKIYSYMDSGSAIVATDLPTHTQVLSQDEAALAEPTVEAFSAALARLLSDDAERARLARNARDLVRRKYSWTAFRATVHGLMETLEARHGSRTGADGHTR
jgi:glycosyltransferase involved in cell wall biosynthesis